MGQRLKVPFSSLLNNPEILEKKKFWRFLYFVKNIPEGRYLSAHEVSDHLEISYNTLKSYIMSTLDLGLSLNLVYRNQDIEKVGFTDFSDFFSLDLSFDQWLAFKLTLLKQSQEQSQEQAPYKKSMLDCFGVLSTDDHHVHDFTDREEQENTMVFSLPVSEEMYPLLSLAINSRELLRLHVQKREDEIFLLPLEKVSIDGECNVIGEDTGRGVLVSIPISDIKKIKRMNATARPQFSAQDREIFIKQLRSFHNHELRLVFKVKHVDLSIDLHSASYRFRNPCMIASPSGEMVWAAHVEPAEDLYCWLYQIKDNIEILDPQHFKKDFEQFCMDQQKKRA